MANIINNTLTVYGSATDLKKFKESVLTENENGEEVFTLNKLVPMPPELHSEKAYIGIVEVSDETQEGRMLLKEKYGFDNWSDWRMQNWGTKWDAEIGGIEIEEHEKLRFYFRTAYATPFYWFQKVAMQFPNLKMKVTFGDYFSQVCGAIYCSNGVAEYFRIPMVYRDENKRPIEQNEEGVWSYVNSNELLQNQNIFPSWRNPFSLFIED